MLKESAVEMLVINPDPALHKEQKGVHENLWIKQRFKQYLSIGVYLDGTDLKYYFFKDYDNTPKIYSSLVALKEDLPQGLENIFANTPKLFIMGHGHGGIYGLCNNWQDPSEVIHNENFDKIIADFEKSLSPQHGEIFVTLEACTTDDRALAAKEGQEKTFLERLSANHRNITFAGTGPWDPKDVETGYRASGGFPILNAPITATGGDIWKHGNSVIFYHDFKQENHQVVVIKSMFASTETAKELKINTIEYASEVLQKTALDHNARKAIISKICTNRDILKIADLHKDPDFPQNKFTDEKITKLSAQEKQILEKEKNNYLTRVREILARAESGRKFTERDILIIALGLKNFADSRELSVFNAHEDLRDEILANKALLELVMVACGKVLIASPSNDNLIDLLLKKGISINSVDEKGMTALHYAVQGFYNYRKEPLNLINKLIDCGANLKAQDYDGRTPSMLANEHSRKATVAAGKNLLDLLQQRLADASPANANPIKSEASTSHAAILRSLSQHPASTTQTKPGDNSVQKGKCIEQKEQAEPSPKGKPSSVDDTSIAPGSFGKKL